jgi:hypothetical protein
VFKRIPSTQTARGYVAPMNIKRIGALSALLLTFGVLAGACSSDSKSSADGDKTAFCKTNTEINDALKTVTDSASFLTAIKTQQGKFDQYLKDAPKAVKADAQILVDDSKKAISSNDAAPFVSDPKIAEAGKNVDTFCGQSASS